MSYNIGDRIELAGCGTAVIETAPSPAERDDKTADIAFKNAIVVDSTGVFKADVCVSDGVISAVGVLQEARKVIDADGFVLTAGRIFTGSVSEAGAPEELLFSGYSTAMFELRSGHETVSEMLWEKNSLPVNLGFIPSDDNHGSCPESDLCPVSNSGNSLSFEGVNSEVRTRIAEQTIIPALRCGVSRYVGTVEVGKLADLFLWRYNELFRKPSKIVKSGRLIYNSVVTDRRDIVYSMLSCSEEWAVRNPCVFFTSPSAAAGYLGRQMHCERNVIAAER